MGAPLKRAPKLSAAATDLLQVRGELAAALRQLSAARLANATIAAELDDVREQLRVADADRVPLAIDNEILREALAEAALVIERCTPRRFFEREVSTRVAGYRRLAGDAAVAKVRDDQDDPIGDEPLPTLGAPAPVPAGETHVWGRAAGGYACSCGGSHITDKGVRTAFGTVSICWLEACRRAWPGLAALGGAG